MNNLHRGFITPLLLALIAILLVGGGAYWYTQTKQTNLPVTATSTGQTLVPQTAITDFQYKQVVQQKAGVIQTGDVVEFSWNGCKLPKSDIGLHLVYPSVGSEKTKRILIADAIQNTNTYQWKIPTTIETGEYEVYIGTNVCHSSEFSKNTIKIQQSVKPFVIFIAPNGESIRSGTTYKIVWTSNSNSNIDIGYRSSSVGNLNNIYWIAKNINDTGSYNWVIPTNLTKSGWTEILISNTETGEQVASDAFVMY